MYFRLGNIVLNVPEPLTITQGDSDGYFWSDQSPLRGPSGPQPNEHSQTPR